MRREVLTVLETRPFKDGLLVRFQDTTFFSRLRTKLAWGGLAALSWTAFKVGALSYGGGFVIIPLMQADAVDAYGWMSQSEFLNAVAFGQLTPGPVTQTVPVAPAPVSSGTPTTLGISPTTRP